MPPADTLLVSWGPGEMRLALMAGDTPLEIRVARPGMLAGALVLGRVVQAAPRLEAAFVDIGRDKPGFLPGGHRLAEGEAVAVRVRAEPRAGKGALLAREEGIDIARGTKPPAVLEQSDPIALALADHPSIARVLVDDPAVFAELRARHGAKVEHDRTGEAARVLDEAMDEALSPSVPLPSGGRVLIENTAALTAIDVDSGRARPAQANDEAVAAIARHLRLRNIGGQVAVDFVSGGGRNALFRLVEAMRKAVADDPVPTHVFGASRLGLIELARERRGASLAESMLERESRLSPRAAAARALRLAVAEAAHRPGARRLVLAVAPEVAAAITSEALAEAETRLGRRLAFRPDSSRGREDFAIEESEA